MPETIPKLNHIPQYYEVIRDLHFAIRLLTRGAANELTELHRIPQPEADVKVLQALACELDTQANLPTLIFSPLLDAIRVSIENDYADALAEAHTQEVESVTTRAKNTLETLTK